MRSWSSEEGLWNPRLDPANLRPTAAAAADPTSTRQTLRLWPCRDFQRVSHKPDALWLYALVWG